MSHFKKIKPILLFLLLLFTIFTVIPIQESKAFTNGISASSYQSGVCQSIQFCSITALTGMNVGDLLIIGVLCSPQPIHVLSITDTNSDPITQIVNVNQPLAVHGVVNGSLSTWYSSSVSHTGTGTISINLSQTAFSCAVTIISVNVGGTGLAGYSAQTNTYLTGSGRQTYSSSNFNQPANTYFIEMDSTATSGISAYGGNYMGFYCQYDYGYLSPLIREHVACDNSFIAQGYVGVADSYQATAFNNILQTQYPCISTPSGSCASSGSTAYQIQIYMAFNTSGNPSMGGCSVTQCTFFDNLVLKEFFPQINNLLKNFAETFHLQDLLNQFPISKLFKASEIFKLFDTFCQVANTCQLGLPPPPKQTYVICDNTLDCGLSAFVFPMICVFAVVIMLRHYGELTEDMIVPVTLFTVLMIAWGGSGTIFPPSVSLLVALLASAGLSYMIADWFYGRLHKEAQPA